MRLVLLALATLVLGPVVLAFLVAIAHVFGTVALLLGGIFWTLVVLVIRFKRRASHATGPTPEGVERDPFRQSQGSL